MFDARWPNLYESPVIEFITMHNIYCNGLSRSKRSKSSISSSGAKPVCVEMVF